MRFTYTNKIVILEDGKRRYIIPTIDIQRLIMRPGSRVLRFEEKGEMVSVPLSSAVGEIEGYALLQDALQDEKQ